MHVDRPGRLVILSGPSCVGKSPLRMALARLYPELWSGLERLVLFNSRTPRPGERDGVDYHFRTRAQVDGPGQARHRRQRHLPFLPGDLAL